MTLASSNCSSDLELGFFIVLITFALLLIVSIALVFMNESDDNKSSWKSIPLIWLWPLRPLWTGEGLNDFGRKWRPVYIVSLIVTILVSSAMYKLGYCHV